MSYKILEGSKANPHIDNIGKFLYDVYVDECKWEFEKDNPSNLSIGTDGKGNKIIRDKFMWEEDFINQTTWIVNITFLLYPHRALNTSPLIEPHFIF